MSASPHCSLARFVCVAFGSMLALVVALSLNRGALLAQSPVYQLRLSPQDTSLNLDAKNYSGLQQLTTYTWPDNKIANAILLKFDFSALPVDATVQDATLKLALIQSDTTADATYAVAVHKIVGKNPSITAATGYKADAVTMWTPNACCNNSIPLAQGDISAAYATQDIDKTLGYKAWPIATLLQEWLATPATNFGLLVNSDASKLRDRYRYFASSEYPDGTLRPMMEITYAVVSADTTAPTVSAVSALSVTSVGATINWSTNEASDSQIEYGATSAYGMSTALYPVHVISHSMKLTGLSDTATYHYHVRSRDPRHGGGDRRPGRAPAAGGVRDARLPR